MPEIHPQTIEKIEQNYPQFIRELPVSRHGAELVQAVMASDTVLLHGGTASGKSIGAPYILQEMMRNGLLPEGEVMSLQLTRTVTENLARYVARAEGTPIQERNDVARKTGFMRRHDSKPATEHNGKNYSTTGILLRQYRDKGIALPGITAIVLDEFDNRDSFTSLGIMLIAETQRVRAEQGIEPLKVILSSATIPEKDLERIQSFFKQTASVEVTGRRFDRQIEYVAPTETALSDRDIIEKTQAAVQRTLKKGRLGHTLITVPGEHEVLSLATRLQAEYPGRRIEVLYGDQTDEEREDAFRAMTMEENILLVATDGIAGRANTFPGLHTVVNSGWTRRKMYDPEADMDIWQTVPQTQNEMEQIEGRVSREAPRDGQHDMVVHVMTQQDAEGRPVARPPAVLSERLEGLVLQMLSLNLDPFTVPWFDDVNSAALGRAKEQLYALGALDDQFQLTAIGEAMAEFPVPPRYARMLVESERLYKHERVDLRNDAALLASVDAVRKPFFKKDTKTASNWETFGSDFLTALRMYREWEARRFSMRWLYEQDILAGGMLELQAEYRSVRAQLLESGARISQRSSSATTGGSILETIRARRPYYDQLFRAGFFDALFRHEDNGEYVRLSGINAGQRGVLSDRSVGKVAAGKSFPPYIITSGVVQILSGKRILDTAHPVIDGAWAYSLSPKDFKRSIDSYEFDQAMGAVVRRDRLQHHWHVDISHSETVFPEDDEELYRQLADMLPVVGNPVFEALHLRNTAATEQLNLLYRYSGGTLQQAVDLRQWYGERLQEQGIRTMTELSRMLEINPDFLTLPFNVEQTSELLNKFPQVVEIHGKSYPVTYEYVPGRKEKEWKKDYQAYVTIPFEEALFFEELPELPEEVAKHQTRVGMVTNVEYVVMNGKTPLPIQKRIESSEPSNLRQELDEALRRQRFMSTNLNRELIEGNEHRPIEWYPSQVRPIVFGTNPVTGELLIALPSLSANLGVQFHPVDKDLRDIEHTVHYVNSDHMRKSRVPSILDSARSLPPVPQDEVPAYIAQLEQEIAARMLAQRRANPAYEIVADTGLVRITSPTADNNGTEEWDVLEVSRELLGRGRYAAWGNLRVVARRPDGADLTVRMDYSDVLYEACLSSRVAKPEVSEDLPVSRIGYVEEAEKPSLFAYPVEDFQVMMSETAEKLQKRLDETTDSRILSIVRGLLVWRQKSLDPESLLYTAQAREAMDALLVPLQGQANIGRELDGLRSIMRQRIRQLRINELYVANQPSLRELVSSFGDLNAAEITTLESIVNETLSAIKSLPAQNVLQPQRIEEIGARLVPEIRKGRVSTLVDRIITYAESLDMAPENAADLCVTFFANAGDEYLHSQFITDDSILDELVDKIFLANS